MPLTVDRAKPAVPFGGIYRLIDFSLSNMINSGFLKVVVLTQYNIYRMDFSQMLDHHIASGLPCTVAGIRQPRALADQFGVIETDPQNRGRIKAFVEKPKDTPGLPDSPDEVLASMGNYIMDADALLDAVTVDAADESSKHDMGGSIVPWFVNQGTAGVYDFKDNDVPGATERDRDYWRDVGTVDAFFDAHQDLISVTPVFNLYNDRWPLFAGYQAAMPPAKFVYGHHERLGHAVDSIVSPGVIVSGGEVISSVLSPGVRVNSWSSVRESVLMDGVNVGRNTVVNRAILDKYVVVEEGAMVGIDAERDRERGFTVTESGITVVAKGQTVPR